MGTLTRDTEVFQSSELSRNSSKVFAAAEEHPILVTRRDGEALVLMTESQADARERLLEFAAQMIAVAIDDRGTLSDRMSERFPWMLALSKKSQKQCAKELIAAARASFSTSEEHLIAAKVNAWRETATALAAGLGRSPVEWLDTPELVESP